MVDFPALRVPIVADDAALHAVFARSRAAVSAFSGGIGADLAAVERRMAAMAANVSEAVDFSFLSRQSGKSARDSAEAFREAFAETDRMAAAAAALRAQLDPAAAAQGRLNAELAEYARLQKAGMLSAEEAASARLAAQQRLMDADIGRAAAGNAVLLPQQSGKSARDSAAAFQEAYAETDRMAVAAAALRAQLDPVAAAQGRLNAELAEYERLQAAGVISAAEFARAQEMVAARTRAVAVAASAVGTARHDAFIAQNATYQLTDLATQIASGGSPSVAILQQGGQIAQMFQGAGGLRAAAAAVGGAFLGMLNPLNLAVVGIAAATSAIAYLTSTADASVSALEKHDALARRIAEGWKEAGGNVAAYKEASVRPSRVELQVDVEGLRKSVAEARTALGAEADKFTELAATGRRAIDFNPAAADPKIVRGVEVYERIAAALRDAQAGGSARQLRDFVEALLKGGDAPAGFLEELDKLTKGLLDHEKALADATGAVTDLDRAIDDTVVTTAKQAEALERLKRAGAGGRTELERLGEDFRLASEGARTMSEALKIASLYQERYNELAAVAGKSASERLRQSRVGAAQVGMTATERQRAQIEADYAERFEAAKGFPGAVATLNQARLLDLQAAAAEARLAPLREVTRAIEDQTAATALQAAAFGKSAGEVARMTTEQKLYLAYAREHIRVGPDLVAQIRQAGDAAAVQADKQAAVLEGQHELIASIDAWRSATKGAISDVLHGIADGRSGKDILRGLLGRMADGAIDSTATMVGNMLYDKDGKPAGGLLGGFLSSVLGGGQRGASPNNPVFVAVSGGSGADWLVGGGGKTGRIESSPLPPPATGEVPGLPGVTYGGSAGYRAAAAGASGYGRINAPYLASLDAKSRYGFTGPREMYEYLLAKGASRNEALMLTGAAANESSFDARAVHDDGSGYGLFGHNTGRMNLRGMTWQQQSEAALAELRRRPESSMVAAATTPEDLARAQMFFEQPRGFRRSNPEGGDNYTGRVNTLRYFSQMGGNPLASVPGALPVMGRGADPAAGLPQVEMAAKFDTVKQSMDGVAAAAGKASPALADASKGFGDVGSSIAGLGSMLGGAVGGKAGGAIGGGIGTLLSLFGKGLGIPGFAEGTNAAPGGPAWVGEKGPELLNLPRGSQVIPTRDLVRIPRPSVPEAALMPRRGGISTTFAPTFAIDAKGAELGVEVKIERAIRGALADYHDSLSESLPRLMAQAQARGY